MRQLDRELQMRLLSIAADAYPSPVTPSKDVPVDFEDEAVIRNLVYLEEHGLLVLVKSRWNDGGIGIGQMTATKDGMDFLEDDGGLSAILGVVTVKLHSETIKDLIALKIQESTLAPDEKRKFLGLLRELPADATKHLVLKLVDMGLAAGGSLAIAAIGKLLAGS